MIFMQPSPLLAEVLADAVASLLGGVRPTEITAIQPEEPSQWGTFYATFPHTEPVGFLYGESSTEPCKITFLHKL